MYFNSYQFFAFFIVFLCCYYATPHRIQNILILAASYLFYASWDYRFLSLIVISTVVDYTAGLGIANTKHHWNRRAWLFMSLTTNLGILAFFKYYNFFADSALLALQQIGFAGEESWGLRIVLPVGISFYTFQTLSYTIDIYRGKLKPTWNFIDFSAYVAFFPQLVAGPIERASDLLPQIQQKRQIRYDEWTTGICLILWGLFEKTVVADNLALVVNDVYAQPTDAPQTILATYAFAFQIFADFDGYSNMARGAAFLLGIRLVHNFNAPYFASNPSEFWQRWHISLSSWLRDYLYIPLGGNRRGPSRTYVNLMITMLLGGLWHGAGWNFVLWGGFHGLLLILYRLVTPYVQLAVVPPFIRRALAGILFFQAICFSWMLFRADNMGHFMVLMHSLRVWPELLLSPALLNHAKQLLLFASIPFCYQAFQIRSQQEIPTLNWNLFARTAFYLLVFYGIVIFGYSNGQSFIYFQF